MSIAPVAPIVSATCPEVIEIFSYFFKSAQIFSRRERFPFVAVYCIALKGSFFKTEIIAFTTSRGGGRLGAPPPKEIISLWAFDSDKRVEIFLIGLSLNSCSIVASSKGMATLKLFSHPQLLLLFHSQKAGLCQAPLSADFRKLIGKPLTKCLRLYFHLSVFARGTAAGFYSP